MKKRTAVAGNLRERADMKLGSTRKKAVRAPRSAPKLNHDADRWRAELEVHRLEFEMQNEELRAARLEVELALASYTEIFDFAPVGYATLTPGGMVREMNHVGASLLGRPRARLIGVSLGNFVSVDHHIAFGALLARALRTETKETCELRLQVNDGQPLCVRASATMLPRASEPLILFAFEDVTDRKARELQLANSEAALREVDRRKNEFLAVLSHELRSPLAPIRTSLFVLGEAPAGSDQERRAREVIERQVDQLSRLVDDLLDVTRITHGKVRLHRQGIDLGALVGRAIDDARAVCDARGLRLEAHVGQGPFWIEGDATRVTQILSNVIGNAEKFTPAGGSLTINLHRQGDDARIGVRDTGVGITKDVLAHVCEPFIQAPQTMERGPGGLGLGLALAKSLVELHGGRIGVSSEGLGRGAEVEISLPLHNGGVDPRPAASRNAAAPARRVVVIEDNADAADMLKEALSLRGHDVRVAYDGPTGIELARAHRPEVVICDIGLPRMDGYAVARAMRADEELKGVYLVSLSGYARPEDLTRASDAGFDQQVAKPASLEMLDQVFADMAAPQKGRRRDTRSLH